MTMITLRTENGHYLMAGPDGWLTAASTERTALNLFELVERAGSTVALKSISPAKYVCVRDGQVCAATEDSQACETFTLCDQGEGRVALKSAGGGFLCAEGGGGGTVVANRAEAGPWERFQIERLDEVAEALNALTCCCGMQHVHPLAGEAAAAAQTDAPMAAEEIGPLTWNDKSHRWLVESAAAILLYHKATLPEAQVFASFWNNGTFRQNVFKGLLDADYVSPYKDTVYSCHFYDPDTRTNIFGNTEWTAFTQCVQYFTQSRQRALQIQTGQDTSDAAFRDAGYALGLSLHYLTDLTQPMHAANFANILPTLNPTDWRHSGFEEYFESIMEQKDNPASPAYQKARALQVNPASVSPAELTSWDFPTIGALVDTLARQSKQVFLKHVKGPADAKVKIIPGPAGPILIITKEWTATEADPAIQAAVPYGQKMAARYLMEWVRRPVSVLPYLPAGMKQGHTGRWAFSGNGADGSWWNGNKAGGAPGVTLLADNGFCLEGEYNFSWGFDRHQGYLRVALTQMQPNGACSVTIRDRGSVWAHGRDFHYEMPASYRLNSDTREITCWGNGFSLWLKPFPANAVWYPGVQCRIQIGSDTYHLCFEDMQI